MRLISGVFLALLVAGFMALTVPRIYGGGPDIGALMLGTPDEHEIASGIFGMIRDRTLDYKVPAYGGAYPNLAFLIAKPLLRAIGPTERHLVDYLRWFSMVFAVLTILGTYWMGKKLTGRELPGLVGAAVVAASPELGYWAVRIHPDTLLLFELILAQLALAFAVHRRSQKWLTWAFGLAILATMTKLVGLFLVPWIALVQVWLDAGSERPIKRLLGRAAWGAGLATLIAYVTTPRLLVASRDFFGGAFGAQGVNTNPKLGELMPPGWAEVLWGTRFADWTVSLGFLVAVALFVPRVARFVAAPRARAEEPTAEAWLPVLPLAFALGYLLYLFVSVRNVQIRYALPVLPTMGVALGLVLDRARARPIGWLALVIVVASFAIGGPARYAIHAKDRAWVEGQARDPRIEAAEWLRKNVKPDARLYYDYGVYVPLRFHNAQKTYGLLRRQVVGQRPEYLVLHDARKKMFTPGSPVLGRPEDHAERVETLAALEAGTLSGFRRVQRFEAAKISIYRDESLQACAPGCVP